MPNSPMLFEEENLSKAWGRVFLATLHHPASNPAPMVLSVVGFQNGIPAENSRIRDELDQLLVAHSKNSCNVSAMIIFPFRQWIRQGRPTCEIFSKWCIERFIPRLKQRDRRNPKGLYFERMMDFRGGADVHEIGKNQLLHLIEWWKRQQLYQQHRPPHSRMQVACFDPFLDHNHECRPCFPCLQQVSFSYDCNSELTVDAFYPTQYIFDRAYGNYLGVCHLGAFMAHEMGLNLVRFNCFVARSEIGGIRKGDLQALKQLVENVLDDA